MKRRVPLLEFWADPNLRRCSHTAKGVWIDLLCLMFHSGHEAYWTEDEIVQAIGGSDPDEVRGCLIELVSKGVASRNEAGAIYSQMLLRDQRKRQLCSEAGKRGGGRPFHGGRKTTVKKGAVKGPVKVSATSNGSPIAKHSKELTQATNVDQKRSVKGIVKGPLKGAFSSPFPLKSSSPNNVPCSTTKSLVKGKPLGRGESEGGRGTLFPNDLSDDPKPAIQTASPPPWFSDADFIEVWETWRSHRKHKRTTMTPEAERLQKLKFARWGKERTLAALTYSTEQGYTGVVEPNGSIDKGDKADRAKAQAARVAALLDKRAAERRRHTDESEES